MNLKHCNPIKDTEQPQFDVDKIEAFFSGKTLPKTLKLDEVTTILDVEKFVRSHINSLKGHEHKPIYIPYYWRLKLLATKLI